MALWKTLKRLREAGLIGQHLGKRRFIGGEPEPGPASVSTPSTSSQPAVSPADGMPARPTGSEQCPPSPAGRLSQPAVMPADVDLSDMPDDMRSAARSVINGQSKRVAAQQHGVCRKNLALVLFKKGVRVRNRGRSLLPADANHRPPAPHQEPEEEQEESGSEQECRARGRRRGRAVTLPVRRAVAAILSGKMSRAAAAARFGVSLNYIYKLTPQRKMMNGKSCDSDGDGGQPADPRVERIRAALAEATRGKDTKVAIAKKYGMSYFTFHYYWKRQQEGKPLPTSGGRRAAATVAAAARPPPPPSPSQPPAEDPADISDAMRKAIGAVILGKMCVKASSTLHRVPFLQLKSLCRSMTARYDSKGVVVVESADSAAPAAEAAAGGGTSVSLDQESLRRLKPAMQAAIRDVLAGTPRKVAAVRHGVGRLLLGRKMWALGVPMRTRFDTETRRSQTGTETEVDSSETEPAAAPVSAAATASTAGPMQKEPNLTNLRPRMAAAVRAVLAGSPTEEAAAAHGVLPGRLRLVLRCRGLAAPAVSKLTLTRTAGGYQVSQPAAPPPPPQPPAGLGLPLREAVERVVLLGESAAAVARSARLDAALLEQHSSHRPASGSPPQQQPSVRDELFVLYTVLALCDAGWDVNADCLRWMFERFLEKSCQSPAPPDDSWLSLEAMYVRWPELAGQIRPESGGPTTQFETAFWPALHGVCDEFELKCGQLLLRDAESEARRRTREVLPLPLAAEPPSGHFWDNRNGSWILEKDGKQQAFFEVETILARRAVAAAGGQPEYLIRWKGYSDSWNTWEPENNLECTATLAAFQTRWWALPEAERRRIIDQLSPVRAGPPASSSAAAAQPPPAPGQPRKGRPSKSGQQTLDSMLAAGRKSEPAAPAAPAPLRVRTDLTAPVLEATSPDEGRSRRSTKARANALFKRWLVSPKLATKKAVQESLAEAAATAGADPVPSPPPAVPSVSAAGPSGPSPSVGRTRQRPNLSVSRALAAGGQRRLDEFVRRSSGGDGAAQLGRAAPAVDTARTPPAAAVAERAAAPSPVKERPSDAAVTSPRRESSPRPDGRPRRARPAPITPVGAAPFGKTRARNREARLDRRDGPVSPPKPTEGNRSAQESIDSETERLRRLDEELRLLDEEEEEGHGGGTPESAGERGHSDEENAGERGQSREESATDAVEKDPGGATAEAGDAAPRTRRRVSSVSDRTAKEAGEGRSEKETKETRERRVEKESTATGERSEKRTGDGRGVKETEEVRLAKKAGIVSPVKETEEVRPAKETRKRRAAKEAGEAEIIRDPGDGKTTKETGKGRTRNKAREGGETEKEPGKEVREGEGIEKELGKEVSDIKEAREERNTNKSGNGKTSREPGGGRVTKSEEVEKTTKEPGEKKTTKEVGEGNTMGKDEKEENAARRAAEVGDTKETGVEKNKNIGKNARQEGKSAEEFVAEGRIPKKASLEGMFVQEAGQERQTPKKVGEEGSSANEAGQERQTPKKSGEEGSSANEAGGVATEGAEDSAAAVGRRSATPETPLPVVRRRRGRPPKSAAKREAAFVKARKSADVPAESAATGGTPDKRSFPLLDDDAPLSKRRRVSEAEPAVQPPPPPTPDPDSAVGKRQRKVPKRFLDGETLLWGETPPTVAASRPSADAPPAASRPGRPQPAPPPPPPLPEDEPPRPITFEPPSKRKPIVFVSPIRKESGLQPTAPHSGVARKLNLDASPAGGARSPSTVMVRTIGKAAAKPSIKVVQKSVPDLATMTILDESADVVIEDGPVIIDESGQLVPARSVARTAQSAPAPAPSPASRTKVVTFGRRQVVVLPPPKPTPAPVAVPAPAAAPVTPEAPVKKRRGRPPKNPRPEDASTSTPTPAPAAAKAGTAKTPPTGKKRGRKPKPPPEPEPEPAAAAPMEEEPEEVTLDLSSLVGPGAGDWDADVGYFDVDGQFVERSPMKCDWSGAQLGLDGPTAADPGVLDSSVVLVHPEPQLDSLSIGGEADEPY